MKLEVVNLNDGLVYDPVFYIGRGVWQNTRSYLGNPFKYKKHKGSNDIYREYLYDQINRRTKVFEELCDLYRFAKHRHVYLGCFCKPCDCHGDVIVELLSRPEIITTLEKS